MPPSPTRLLLRTDLVQSHITTDLTRSPTHFFRGATANVSIPTQNPPRLYANAFGTKREKSGHKHDKTRNKSEKRLKKVLHLCVWCVKI